MDGTMTEGPGADLEVTVVCNVFNEEARIPGLLGMLEMQQMTGFRVVFVDDGSTDRTRDVISAYDGPLDIHLISLDHVGLAPARNHGLTAVEGGVAVVIDADMSFDAEWLPAIRRLFESDPRIGGSFSRVAASGDAWVARGGQAVREVVYWIRSRSGRPWMIGHGMAVRSRAYESLGFSADRLTAEDLELSELLIDAGWRVVPLGEPAIRTEDPATFAGVWRRHLTVGRRTAHLFSRHPRFMFRPSNAGRLFPAVLLGAGLIDPRLAIATEIGVAGVLVRIMARRGVTRRDLAPGLVVFHIQTVASFVGLVMELTRILEDAKGRIGTRSDSIDIASTIQC